MELRIAESYIPEFGRIAQKSSTVVLPANLTDLGGMIAMARGIFKPQNGLPKAEDVSSADVPKIVRAKLDNANHPKECDESDTDSATALYRFWSV
jgi:hypothetical protein